MATKPDNSWPAAPTPPQPSPFEKAYVRVLGTCVCVAAIAATSAFVHVLFKVAADICTARGAA